MTKPKKHFSILPITFFLLFLFGLNSCAYKRIGDLTMVSNRNIDGSVEYALLKRNVSATVKTKKNDALERAIDKATESNNGDYLMNVKIFVKNNGAKIKVQGDVYGVPPKPQIEVDVETSVTKKINFEVGDGASFKNLLGQIIEGKILGINQSGAVVEYTNSKGEVRKKEVSFVNLTKIERN